MREHLLKKRGIPFCLILFVAVMVMIVPLNASCSMASKYKYVLALDSSLGLKIYNANDVHIEKKELFIRPVDSIGLLEDSYSLTAVNKIAVSKLRMQSGYLEICH